MALDDGRPGGVLDGLDAEDVPHLERVHGLDVVAADGRGVNDRVVLALERGVLGVVDRLQAPRGRVQRRLAHWFFGCEHRVLLARVLVVVGALFTLLLLPCC